MRPSTALSYHERIVRAVAAIEGELERLGDTYAWLARTAIPANGARLRRAPFIELYLTSPETTPAKDLLTEVMLPVHPHRPTSS